MHDPTQILHETYELISEVGQGAFGYVYKARCIETGEIVALKQIKLRSSTDELPSSCISEIDALSKVHHDNIISLREVFSESDYTYLVFDYCEYDLASIIKSRKGISPDQLKNIFRQIVLGLQECHHNSLIHRDIKSANILLTPDQKVKVTDFGLSTFLGSKKLSPNVGSLFYRSPEMLFGSTNYGPEVDIWALGCVLYEMITGSVPFYPNGDRDIDQLAAILNVHGAIDSSLYESYSKGTAFSSLINQYSEKSLEKFLDLSISDNFSLARDLLVKMFDYNPKTRITADEILEHPFIKDISIDPRRITSSEIHQGVKVKKPKFVVSPVLIRPSLAYPTFVM